MSEWSLACEYLGLILTAIMAVFYHDPRQPRSGRRRLFSWCLGWCAISTVLNCLTVYFAPYAKFLPRAFNYGLNSLYYLSSVVMFICVAQYLVNRIYEYDHDSPELVCAGVIQGVIFAIYVVLCVANLFTGILFSFDGQANYVRGPLNSSGYLGAVVEAVLVVICYLKNKSHASRSVAMIIRYVPTIAVLLIGYQVLYPNQLMNGFIGSVANFILFVNFQSCRVEIDQLTELPNRQSFASELEHRIRSRSDMKVILVSIRKFTQVNRIYGHAGGDAILHQFAQALGKSLSFAHVFRFGGSVFAAIVPTSKGNRREGLADQIAEALDRRWVVGRHTASVNICVVELDYDAALTSTPEELIRQLEYTLGAAKEDDLPYLSFDEQVRTRYLHHVEIKHDVETAIENDRFEVWYQPIYNHDSGRFDTAEALVRMRDDQGNLVPPDEFVPIAETSGLIESITWIVIEDTCRLLGSRAVPGLERVSVNLTAKQLLQHNLAGKLAATLKRHHVRPEQLKLEITERTITENGDLVAQAMKELSEQGFDFLMDDFGTGYSNLAGVLNMPFSYVKLDRSLMEGIESDERSRLMARELIGFFHEMGHTVVTEGIENAEQAELVLSYGADCVQGYYYARPMAQADLEAWAEARQ